jgi:hypothetical protein
MIILGHGRRSGGILHFNPSTGEARTGAKSPSAGAAVSVACGYTLAVVMLVIVGEDLKTTDVRIFAVLVVFADSNLDNHGFKNIAS